MSVQTMTVHLTDAEWLDLLDREGEGLPMCCANISGLRDQIRLIFQNQKIADIQVAQEFNRYYHWCFPAHELPDSPVHWIHKQIVDVFGDND